MEKAKTDFTPLLLSWYHQHEKRDLPWKASNNPYFIWLSEIILQQTRVEQGKPYYQKFIAQYPSIQDLAQAPQDEVLKLWQGLGYYSRARNLHFTAKFILENYAGEFPDDYERIRALKGVGDYTAAAIASFAFDLPYTVVDGNVYRLLSRYFGISTPIDSSKGKKQFKTLAQELLPPQEAAHFNQALMDFGALICKPKSPDCRHCPLAIHCKAFKNQKVDQLPVKAKKLKKKTRYFYYLVWKNKQDELLLHKRQQKDIWQGLYDFPLLEGEQLLDTDTIPVLAKHPRWQEWWGSAPPPLQVDTISNPQVQQLSHQKIVATFIRLEQEHPIFFEKNSAYLVVNPKNLKNFALPKIVASYINDIQLNLFG